MARKSHPVRSDDRRRFSDRYGELRLIHPSSQRRVANRWSRSVAVKNLVGIDELSDPGMLRRAIRISFFDSFYIHVTGPQVSGLGEETLKVVRPRRSSLGPFLAASQWAHSSHGTRRSETAVPSTGEDKPAALPSTYAPSISHCCRTQSFLKHYRIGCDVWPTMSENWAVQHAHPLRAVDMLDRRNLLALGNVT